MKKHRIVFATGNAGKMKEIRQIMADLGCEVVSMKPEQIRKLRKMEFPLRKTLRSKPVQSGTAPAILCWPMTPDSW